VSLHLSRCSLYYVARRAYDEAHAASSAAYEAMKQAERQLIDAMNDEGVRNFKLEDGTQVSLRKRFDVSVNQDDEFLVREWLTETQGDIKLFSKEVLDKTAITKLLKQQVEGGTLDETNVPEFFKLNQSPTINVRGWQGAKDDE